MVSTMFPEKRSIFHQPNVKSIFLDLPESIISSILPGTVVLATIAECVFTMSFSLPIDKFSIIHGTIGPLEETLKKP